MRKSVITSIVCILLLGGAGINTYAQDSGYKATPVTVSKDKVRSNGKLYYSHVVLERQTLFSISKAYNVTLQEIYDANPALNLETEGLKTYQILLIPIKDGAQQDIVTASAPAVTAPVQEGQSGDYMIHTVKWYEDLNSIAKKYGVSPEAIMKANGMKTATLSRKQKLKIPAGGTAEDVPYIAGSEESGAQEDKSILETISEAITEKAEEIFYVGKQDISAALILPFNAQKQPNDNNLDFYSGVLMAVRDLKAQGINTDLSVYDAAGGVIPVTEEKMNDCDVILGPISTTDITSTLKITGSRTPLVSPLEPKAADLVAVYGNLIQAPSSTDAQCEDLIAWLKEENRKGDAVLLMTEKGSSRTAAANALANALANSGLTYSTISYGLLEGRDISARIMEHATETNTVRIVVASESEAFVNDVVRNANLVAHRKRQVALYCTSRVRSFETIEVENLHNTNLHTSLSYYVDYDSPKVQKFVMAYRALFNTEPGPFAFQGYDTASYFCTMCSKYGKRWMDKLGYGRDSGLQSDFEFRRTESGGYVNTAVRRILYEPDFRIVTASGK